MDTPTITYITCTGKHALIEFVNYVQMFVLKITALPCVCVTQCPRDICVTSLLPWFQITGKKLAGRPFLTDENRIFCGEQVKFS